MQEIWKPIPGFGSSYEASSLGRIRSVDRMITAKNGIQRYFNACVLMQQETGRRYRVVSLVGPDGIRTAKVHRMIAFAFIPNPRELKEVNHKNGDKLNNAVENLEWCSREQNNRHAIKMGLKLPRQGEKHGCAVLTNAQVLKIRELRSAGATGVDVARMFGVSTTTISDIHSRKIWKHI